VINKNLLKKNFIQNKYLNKKIEKKLSKYFNRVFNEIENKVNTSKTIYNVLSSNYQFNFDFKDLKKFQKFNTIAIIGMGGSILGIQAIYEFLNKKIKKKIYFFDDIDEKKINNFKKKKC